MSIVENQATESNIIVAALYQFRAWPDYQSEQRPLLDFCLQKELKGTLLLAEEGINGTVAGNRKGIDALKQYLLEDLLFEYLEYKESAAASMPFHRMKVKLKKEIVTLGKAGVSPTKLSGIRLSAKEWNKVVNDPEVLVIDTRNQYEIDIGTFKNAISPNTETFRQFPDYIEQNLDPSKHKKVAMFCTGGIRCEKASSYMMAQGFEEVYQLNGGILRYLEDVVESGDENLWQGDCFVFDGRVSVDERLQEGNYEQCFACRHPISDEDMSSGKYEKGISCPNCYDDLDEKKRSRFSERQKQVELAEQKGIQHIGGSITTMTEKISS